HRLITRGEIDDRKPPMAERDAGRVKKSFTIWSAMADRGGHVLDQCGVRVLLAAGVEPPRYSAHARSEGVLTFGPAARPPLNGPRREAPPSHVRGVRVRSLPSQRWA